MVIKNVPLFNNTELVWKELAPIYKSELAGLAFEKIPEDKAILESFKLITNCI